MWYPESQVFKRWSREEKVNTADVSGLMQDQQSWRPWQKQVSKVGMGQKSHWSAFKREGEIKNQETVIQTVISTKGGKQSRNEMGKWSLELLIMEEITCFILSGLI